MAISAMPTGAERRSLQARFAALRRRLRFVITLRGVGVLVSVLLAAAIVAGLIDWLIHLPSLLRAVALTVTLSGVGFLGYWFLLRPLTARADDLSLALRVEEKYPALNDCLASTVQFLEQPGDAEQFGSPSMRREAVHNALRRVQGCDFNRVIDSSGVLPASVALVVSCVVAVVLLLLWPAQAWTALTRLANPFGGEHWPQKTRLLIEKPTSPVGRNAPFEIRGEVHGKVIPDQATVTLRVDDQYPEERTIDVTRDKQGVARLALKVDLTRVQRSLVFQVRANDAVSEEYLVRVLPPPLLAPLDGRASPQVRLVYPSYTDLPPLDLPDGTGNVEAVAGTRVLLRAAANRPLDRAWVEYRPEPRSVSLAALLSSLGARHPADALPLGAAGREVWERVPARLDADRRSFRVEFLPPRVSGMYALGFVDKDQLPNERLFELRILADPSPTVTVMRPSANRDSLTVLPGATLNLQALAEDMPPAPGMAVHAVRNVYLEYRCQKTDAPRRLLLYDHQLAAEAAARVLAEMVAGPVRAPVTPQRLREPRVLVNRRLALSEFRHLDAARSPLKDGDVLTLQVCAEDFDNVALDKQPGRSHEIEVRIVNRNALDLALNREQAKVQQELVKLREQERAALKKVTEVEKRLKEQQRLEDEDTVQLLQAETLQQQIRERIGDKQEGLRAEVQRLLDTFRDNNLPRSVAQERMEEVAAELGRLAREQLELIEPRLANARKQEEPAAGQKPSPRKQLNALAEARHQQAQVEKALTDLLARLDPWSSTLEVKGETRAILEEQRKLHQQLEELKPKLDPGTPPAQLKPEQKRELARLQEEQAKLQERTNKLLEKMDQMSRQRKELDPETARKLERTHEQGRSADITGEMKQARERIGENKLNEAGARQEQSIRDLQRLVQSLEDRRGPELDRLIKKLRETEQKLDELAREQDELRKKIAEASQLADPQKREEALRQLSRAQKELQKKQEDAQEMLRQLSRQRGERAAQELARAGAEMEQAMRRLERGQNAEEQEQEALDRLQEARRELARAREEAEEELAREQMERMADEITRLKERQEGLVDGVKSIQKELSQRRKEDRRNLLLDLAGKADPQRDLGKETAKLAENKLAQAQVFARMLRKAAEAMEQAGDRISQHSREAGAADKAETEAGAEAFKLQQEALRRLVEVLEALKPEPGAPLRPGQGGAGGEGGGGGGGGGGEGDGIPPLAQLKLLRAMQADVNRRTEAFTKKHPDPAKYADKEKAELETLRRDQQEIADLLEQLIDPKGPEGEKP